MNKCPSADRNNPMYQDFEEDVCAWCGTPIPDGAKLGTWHFEGFCDAQCALLQTLSDDGIAHGMVCHGSREGRRQTILRAVDDLCALRRAATPKAAI